MKNFIFLFSFTFCLMSVTSCIKKKKPGPALTQRPAQKGAAKKLTPAQVARQKAARQKANKTAAVKPNTAGKPVGYWPSLRQHLDIDFAVMLQLKNIETKRLVDLAKAGVNAATTNSKYDADAKKLLGPVKFAKMQSFTMK